MLLWLHARRVTNHALTISLQPNASKQCISNATVAIKSSYCAFTELATPINSAQRGFLYFQETSSPILFPKLTKKSLFLLTLFLHVYKLIFPILFMMCFSVILLIIFFVVPIIIIKIVVIFSRTVFVIYFIFFIITKVIVKIVFNVIIIFFILY